MPGTTFAQELPRAGFDNTFYMLPLYEEIRVGGGLTYQEKEEQMMKMKYELGPGNLYHRLGFSFIYSPYADSEVRQVCELAQKHGLHVGLISPLQSHTRPDYRNVADQDIRLYQWRMDGVDWKGAYTSSGTLEVAENERDYKIPTPSRYAAPLREYNHQKIRKWGRGAMKLMADYPGVVVAINGPIEEELAIGGLSNTAKLADYSPFAITEFRDWLRHSGLYDDTDGTYAGEGASQLVIGDLVDFNGTLRSQFYDDPTPANSNGTGISFNAFFGTSFYTWSLKYWDLEIWPDPKPVAVYNRGFDCSPESGNGFTAGGFDAPRVLNVRDPFWVAWSYDVPDQGGKYPAGNPDMPAYGFRQHMVRNFIRDQFDVLAEEGISGKMMYAHQIPGEILGNFTGAGGRNRSAASTIWTGYLEKSGTVGITRFGDIDPQWITQYAGDWGIFEWHTMPNPHLTPGDLYTTSMSHMVKFYENSCHMLFPGWWKDEPPASNEIFPLNDSDFGRAIHDFMGDRGEVPYNQQGAVPDYTPPKVEGVAGEILDETNLSISWDDHIWPDLVARWHEWDSLDHFEVQIGRNGTDWLFGDTTSATTMTTAHTDTTYLMRVRAWSTQGVAGPWSETASSFRDTSVLNFIITAEYDTLFADPDMTNEIMLQMSDPEFLIDPDSVTFTIRGEGSYQNTTPVEADTGGLFWPMNSINEVGGSHGLNELEVSGGILSAVVSTDEPVDPYFYFSGSSLDGSALPHIAFRLYSSRPSGGQFYWFEGGNFYSTAYEIREGWHLYHLDSMAEWISLSNIEMFRLDPGGTGGEKIKLDWLAISDFKLSGTLEGDIAVDGSEISLVTSPTANKGSYTIIIELGSLADSIIIYTDTINQKPFVDLVTPVGDTTLELGNSVGIAAVAGDNDGEVSLVRLMVNDIPVSYSNLAKCSMEWMPDAAGLYQIRAEATDNANDTVSSGTSTLEIFAQQSYSGEPHPVPGLIQAEDYDMGGPGVAYLDNDTANLGGAYRQDEVDIAVIPGDANGYYVGWTGSGEWMEYLIETGDGMKTEVLLRVASSGGVEEFHLELNDRVVTNHIFVESTGGEQVFDTVRIEDLFIPEGVHKLKIFIDRGGFNLDHIEVVPYQVLIQGVVSEMEALSLYPNPASFMLRISVPGGERALAEIWSVNGVLEKQSILGAGNQHLLPVDELSAGIYVLHLVTGDKVYRGKFVKQ
ncbi:MAG: carbohydrate-binding domain-containing protein [Bacteroidota bacterium]